MTLRNQPSDDEYDSRNGYGGVEKLDVVLVSRGGIEYGTQGAVHGNTCSPIPNRSPSSTLGFEYSFQTCDNQVESDIGQRSEYKQCNEEQLFEALVNQGDWFVQFRSDMPSAMDCYRRALTLKRDEIIACTAPIHTTITFSNILFKIGIIQSAFVLSGPTHPHSIDAESLSSGFDYLDRAIKAFDWCLDIRRKCYGSQHPEVGIALYHLAKTYNCIEEHMTAFECLQEAIAIESNNEPSYEDLQGSTRRLFELWVEMGSTQLSLDDEDDSESSFIQAFRVVWSLVQQREQITNSDIPNKCQMLVNSMAEIMDRRGNVLGTPRELNQASKFVEAAVSLDISKDVIEQHRYRDDSGYRGNEQTYYSAGAA